MPVRTEVTFDTDTSNGGVRYRLMIEEKIS